MNSRNCYAVTIQVPPSKKVLLKDDCLCHYYSSLSYNDQKKYFEEILSEWSFDEKYYELTISNKRVHLHGAIHLTPAELQQFSNHLTDLLVTPKHNIHYVLKAEIIYDKAGWHAYITKQLPKSDPFCLLKNDFLESP